MAGMGLAQMNSILSSQTMLQSAADMSRNRNVLQSGQGVLATQIEGDKALGVNTKVKEEQYAQVEESTANLLTQIGEISGDLTQKIADDSEAIRTEEAAQTDAAKKAAEEEAKTTPAKKPEQVTPAVSVEISASAHRAAATAPAPVPEIIVPQPVQAGEVVNVKA
jgi:hypothetical protein